MATKKKAKTKVKAKAKPKTKAKAKVKAKPKPKTADSKLVIAAKKRADEVKQGPPIKYTKGLCRFLPYMFENGETVAEVCAGLYIVRDTFYRWKKEYPEFKEAVDHGKELGEAWWSRVGRLGAIGKVKNINAAMWIFNMKNRYGWQDKTEIENKNERDAIALQIDPDMSPKDAESAYFQILKDMV